MSDLIASVRPKLHELESGDILVVVDYVAGFVNGDLFEVKRDNDAPQYEQLYIDHVHGKFYLFRQVLRDGTGELYGLAKISINPRAGSVKKTHSDKIEKR